MQSFSPCINSASLHLSMPPDPIPKTLSRNTNLRVDRSSDEKYKSPILDRHVTLYISRTRRYCTTHLAVHACMHAWCKYILARHEVGLPKNPVQRFVDPTKKRRGGIQCTVVPALTPIYARGVPGTRFSRSRTQQLAFTQSIGPHIGTFSRKVGV
jgi:hypothetical protein